jgi:iron(III) transport system substrate-binding protein
MFYRRATFVIAALLSTLSLSVLEQNAATAQSGGVLNIYSSRHYGAMELPFTKFEEATGIEIRVSQGAPQDLLARLRADIGRGNRSPADLFLAIDAGVLSLAAAEGLLQPVDSETLRQNIDETQRDPDDYWFGISQRVRTAIYNPENVTGEELEDHLNSYSDLANPVWANRLCMRPASHIYTVSWTSSLIYNLGEDKAAEVISGIADNVVRYIDSDTSQITAVAAGECDVALVNHYYLGILANGSQRDKAVFEAVELRWMNQGEDGTGAFYNINGAGVVLNAANAENAIAFLEYMSSLEGQAGDETGFPGSNYEFPANPNAEINETIAAFGPVKLDTGYPLWEYGRLQADAVDLLEIAGFGFSEN